MLPLPAVPRAARKPPPLPRQNPFVRSPIDLGLPKCGQTVWARVARLHGFLCQERTFTAVSLAEELETDKRTIKRTVAFMRYSLGAPVVFDKQHATYRYTGHWPFLPLVCVRPDEAYVLKLLRRLLPNEVGSPLGAALSRLLHVNARQPLIHFRPFRSDPPPHEQTRII
jgi:hypothetical protein